MPPSLSNLFLHLQLDTDHSTWSLSPLRLPAPPLQELTLGASYRCEGRRVRAFRSWRPSRLDGPALQPSPHGFLKQIELESLPDERGVVFTLAFALPEAQPFLLWRITAANHGSSPVFIERLTLLEAASLRFSDPTSLAFFSNGWNSFNYTGVYGARDRFRRTRLGFFAEPVRLNAGTPHPRQPGHFGSDMFGVLGDRRSRQAILAGFLSQKQHFGSLEARLQRPSLTMWANGDGARLDPGCSLSTDWAFLGFLEVDSPDSMGPYLQAVAREHGLDASLSAAAARQHGLDTPVAATTARLSRFSPHPSPTGWCSWYQFFSAVTAADIRRNLASLQSLRSELPLDFVQIDDGFGAHVGDWFDFKPAFPEGVAPLAAEIRQAGFTPGLWLAPFVLDPASRLAHEHPDWLLRGRLDRPANAGFLFNGFFAAALDLTYPAAAEHVCRLIHTAVHEWGFPYLKLDFLYAAALPGRRHDPTQTRAQCLRRALQLIRQEAGEKAFLLGCGCPLGSGVGLVDAMRIGADVDVRWRPAIRGIETFFHKEPDLPSLRNSLHNILSRSMLHRRWWLNDPDCLLLRPDTLLTVAEQRSLASAIALSGGALLLSDDLGRLPPERLRLAQALFPPIGQTPRLLDWFDSSEPSRLLLELSGPAGAWHLLALFNWADSPRDLNLRPADYPLPLAPGWWAREFWSETLVKFTDALTLPAIPAHGVALLALRPLTPGQPQYLGSGLHISQGLEVKEWAASPSALSLRLERPGRSQGMLALALPAAPREARLDGASLPWQAKVDGAYSFSVEFESAARLEIAWDAAS